MTGVSCGAFLTSDAATAARPRAGCAMNAVDTSVPHTARRYNYWLGGKDNFAADRASGDAIAERWPQHRGRRQGEPGVPAPRRQVLR